MSIPTIEKAIADATAPPTVEQGVRALVDDAKRCVQSRFAKCEAEIARHPGRAVAIAVGVGVLLHRLPVRSLIVANVKLLAALTPPLLLALGSAKAAEYLQRQARR